MIHSAIRTPLLFALTLAAAHADPVIGSIGDINLTTGDVRDILDAASAMAGQPIEADPESIKTLIRATLIQRLVLEHANAANHADAPGVAKEIERARDAALVESFLRASSEAPADFPSDEQIQEFYQDNRDGFLVPKTWRVAQIFIADEDPTTSAEAEAKLARVLDVLTPSAEDFASVARKYSDDLASAPDGGELGWLRDDHIQPGIRTALPGLKINETSAPIRLEAGWHIIRLIDAREAHTPPLAELAPRIRALLRANRARENREQFLTQLLSETPPAINEIELLKLK